MNGITCQNCGLVNFDSEGTCRRCGQEIRAMEYPQPGTFTPPSTPPYFPPPAGWPPPDAAPYGAPPSYPPPNVPYPPPYPGSYQGGSYPGAPYPGSYQGGAYQGVPYYAPYPGMPDTRSQGLAIASLVLGIASWALCGFASIVGLVLGIVATRRAVSFPAEYRGKGMAIAGICLNGIYLVLITAIIIAVIAIPGLRN